MLYFVRKGCEKMKKNFFQKVKKNQNSETRFPPYRQNAYFKTISEHLMRCSDYLDQFENCGISGIQRIFLKTKKSCYEKNLQIQHIPI